MCYLYGGGVEVDSRLVSPVFLIGGGLVVVLVVGGHDRGAWSGGQGVHGKLPPEIHRLLCVRVHAFSMVAGATRCYG